jgi:2-C-methyl-D-erythritol 4-phosphate cytidylyltransferase
MPEATQIVGAILPAAGTGKRFGGVKQLRKINGRTLIEHALQPFLEIPQIHEIVVVVPERHMSEVLDLINPLALRKRMAVVVGGQRRQDSVQLGLKALSAECALVCIHDAARPVISARMIMDTITACDKYDGAIAAIPASDTLKSAHPGKMLIKKTIPRETIWRAQTPQTFRRAALEEALSAAGREKITGTDEAFLLERLGSKIVLVEGSANNIKVTTPEDWIIAEALLKEVNND